MMFQSTATRDRVGITNAIAFGIKRAEINLQPDRQLAELLANLAPETPWAERQLAARKLGYFGNADAVPALLAALPVDPFWMVRCAIIQALELIGDAAAIPTLRNVATTDDFEVVRAYAGKAIDGITQ